MLLKPLPKKYLGVVIIPGIMRQPINWCNLKDKLKPEQWCKKCKNNLEAGAITENTFKNLLQIIPTLHIEWRDKHVTTSQSKRKN